MGEAPIPGDVMKVARGAWSAMPVSHIVEIREAVTTIIARAILADREAQAKRVEELEAGIYDAIYDMRSLYYDAYPEGTGVEEYIGKLSALLAKEGSDA